MRDVPSVMLDIENLCFFLSLSTISLGKGGSIFALFSFCLFVLLYLLFVQLGFFLIFIISFYLLWVYFVSFASILKWKHTLFYTALPF